MRNKEYINIYYFIYLLYKLARRASDIFLKEDKDISFVNL